MKNKYKTPKIDMENVISFTCSDGAIESVLELLNNLKDLGEIGSSRNIVVEWGGRYNKEIFFDGDGSARVNNITINGLSEDAWDKEWKRLGVIFEDNIDIGIYEEDEIDSSLSSGDCNDESGEEDTFDIDF